MIFIYYPKCSTCIKAKKYLDNKKRSYVERDIVKNNPNVKELDKWIKLSGKEIKSFFNTSGLKYKALNLKDTLKDLSYDEKLKILSSDGMLVKRPILVLDNKVLVGFKEAIWEENI